MRKMVIAFTFGGLALAGIQNGACASSLYQAEQRSTLQLSGQTTRGDAEEVIAKLVEAQNKIRSGEDVYFQLLSGAPASYPMTMISPREAFLSADFSQPFSFEQLHSDSSLWVPYRLILTPNGVGNLLWDVEVVLGSRGRIERIEMLYRPPHPF